MMRLRLTKAGIAFEEQVPLCAATVADFLIGDSLAVYADGDYWHTRPEALLRDPVINATLTANGFTVLRYSETEINTNIDGVIDDIKKHMR